MELYIPPDQLEAYQATDSVQIWDVEVNFFANSTLSVTHPSVISEGELGGIQEPVFWYGLHDYTPQFSEVSFGSAKSSDNSSNNEEISNDQGNPNNIEKNTDNSEENLNNIENKEDEEIKVAHEMGKIMGSVS